ncbi:hypothetical protein Tsubulata_018818 [Turnera subulata]|uniref:Rieske domain-containing protein n=1 Tax=Turnera subulata TaxID=218843 RepID=A0A9Q0FJM4_9ROSI|nr:hypothetical protein Tsubulata_018818 [Turnera subulata]
MNAVATAAALSLPISLCRSSKLNSRKGVRVFALFGEEGALPDKKSAWGPLFDVEDPRSKMPQLKGKFLDVNQALEVARYDIQYLDWRARQDLLTIMIIHEKVVEVLNPLARDYKSIGTLKKELADLQEQLTQAHRQVHISEARVATALDKLAHMETLVNDRLLQDKNATIEPDQASPAPSTSTPALDVVKRKLPRKSLNVSGPVQSYHPQLKNFWYPVAFSNDLKDDTMIPIDCFEEPWVIFRGKDGKPGCVQNTCAHRACPLHLGSVNEGRIQCPYHGWEYSTDGKCEKMPSTRLLNVKIKSLPCFEKEGMIWMHLNLVPAEGNEKSLYDAFSRHAILLKLNFAPVLKHIPFMRYLWRHFAEQVLNEDLRLVVGQQERMLSGANIWNCPVTYDKLGVRYRLWRDAVESGAKRLPFTK